jgi:quercetin dioxygenase-like cupin family protein
MKPLPITEGAEFDLPAAARDLRSDEAYERDGHTARTLVREHGLRIVLIVMKSGSTIAEHQSQGAVSIQTIAGDVRVVFAGRTVDLPAGQLSVLAPTLPHAVEAAADSTLLLTLAWSQR